MQETRENEMKLHGDLDFSRKDHYIELLLDKIIFTFPKEVRTATLIHNPKPVSKCIQ